MVDGEWHTFEYIYEYDGTFATSKIDNVTYKLHKRHRYFPNVFQAYGKQSFGKACGKSF